MSKRCTKCGAFLTDTDRFCPSCGENAPQELESTQSFSTDNTASQNTQAQNNTYSYGTYNYNTSSQPYAPSSAPQYNPYAGQDEEMSVGKWVLTIFLTTCLSIVSIVLLFVWAFGDGPKARQNYCKAMLIFIAICIGVSILFGGIFGIAVIGALSSLFESIDSYSGLDLAESLAAFLG